ncbi:MAG: 5-(carboxyamino)imidazole ribonucleotide synthase [Anaerolineae bacterium]|nr:5-(carboxyamino)imidazole ribonucleotide synthase [Anaerolineae bacterium]
MRRPILPPATIGILGSGQLGQMLALAARSMGYRVHVLSPRPEPTPTGMVADKVYTVPYDDLDAVRAFAQGVNVVTYEFENVPAATAAACAEFAPLHPDARALHIAQNRLREKAFFTGHGLPTAPYAPVHDLAELEAALASTGVPAILKTATSGYDGKGQVYVERADSAAAEGAWQAIGQQPAVLEGFVDFACELSVVAARGQDGCFAHYGPIANDHADHILDVSVAPARVADGVAAEAVAIARSVVEGLELVGVLCVELFLTGDGRLLANEIAPRPHNSGHLTIEACTTSQFEQQLRAVCGLPLGDTGYRRPAAMANLLGDLWFCGPEPQSPDWSAVLANPHVKLHLYGKAEARPGRKMGHLTALAETPEAAKAIVLDVRRRLLPES